MKNTASVTKRTLMKLGSAAVLVGPLLGAAGSARADEHDPLATLLDQREDLLRALTAGRAVLPTDIVYIQSNIATNGGNSILGFRRTGDGSLTPLPDSPYATGGNGFFIPTLLAGPSAGDQQIVIDRLRGVLYTINGGSNSIAAMRIAPDGSLRHLSGSPFPSGGNNPSSIGLRFDSLIVTHADSSAASFVGPNPSVILFAIDRTGGLTQIPSTKTALPAGSSPTQALTTATGLFTFVNNIAAGTVNSFLALALDNYGLVHLIDSQVPPQQAGAPIVPTPLGLAANSNASILYVGFATTEQLGVYRWDEFGRLTFLRSATNSGQAICWLRVNDLGRRLYTSNAADRSISVYDTTVPDRPIEIQHLKLADAHGILTQFEMTHDQKFIYALEIGEARADLVAGIVNIFPSQLRAFTIESTTGAVSEGPSARTSLSLPANTIPQGVATL